jgi:hypothetical protein
MGVVEGADCGWVLLLFLRQPFLLAILMDGLDWVWYGGMVRFLCGCGEWKPKIGDSNVMTFLWCRRKV